MRDRETRKARQFYELRLSEANQSEAFLHECAAQAVGMVPAFGGATAEQKRAVIFRWKN